MRNNTSHRQSEIWQHVKSGRFYKMEDDNARMEASATPAVAYRSLFDGQLWVRPAAEFFDGRFRNLSIDEIAPRKDERAIADILHARKKDQE